MRSTAFFAFIALIAMLCVAAVSAQNNFHSQLHAYKQYRTIPSFTTYTNVTAAELLTLFKKSAIYVVDVREQDEYKAGHIPGALNYPLSTIDQTWDLLPTDQPLYVHCKGGVRSLKAIAILETKTSPFQLVNVSDGFDAWTGPVEKDTDPATTQSKKVSSSSFESMLAAVYAMGLAPQPQQPQPQPQQIQSKKVSSSFESMLAAVYAMGLAPQQQQPQQQPIQSKKQSEAFESMLAAVHAMGLAPQPQQRSKHSAAFESMLASVYAAGIAPQQPQQQQPIQSKKQSEAFESMLAAVHAMGLAQPKAQQKQVGTPVPQQKSTATFDTYIKSFGF